MPVYPPIPFPGQLEAVEGYLKQYELKAGKGYSLERMQSAVAALGHPERKFKVIHIGGTSGKGSTCTMIAKILQAAGFHVGLSVSPSLVSPLERVQINGRQITERSALKWMERLWPIILQYQLSYFETFTLLTFAYFAEQGVDYGVIEVGLGGKYDATNVVIPTVAVVTEVGLDHTEILGRTRALIARDKEAIIKPGCIGLTGSTFVKRGKYIPLDRARITRADLTGTVFHYKSLRQLQLKLVGAYQVRNAILAIEIAQALNIAEDAIRYGLRTVQQIGRFQIIRKHPLMIADGAHNPQKMTAFVNSYRQIVPPHDRTIVLCSVKKTKDLIHTLKPLLPIADKIIFTTFEYSAQLQKLAQTSKQLRPHLTVKKIADANQAYHYFKGQIHANDVGVITGSLYLIGKLQPLL